MSSEKCVQITGTHSALEGLYQPSYILSHNLHTFTGLD